MISLCLLPSQRFHYSEPHSNVLDFFCYWSPTNMYKKCFKGRSIFLVLPVVEVNFLGIQPQLKDVVAQSKERSEGEGADKDGDESVLETIDDR